MLAIVYFFSLLTLMLAVGALAYLLTGKLLGATRLSLVRVIGLVLLQIAANAIATVALKWFERSPSETTVTVIAGLFMLAVGVWSTASILGLSGVRAFGAWVFYFIVVLGVGLAATVGLTTYVTQSYAASSNGMAPAIIGPHFLETCPHCSGGVVTSEHLDAGICRDCRRTSPRVEPIDKSKKPGSVDRFMVDKTAQPQRWDLVAYRLGNQTRVSRLAGLPGETIELRNGEIWIDGQQATYAPEMVGLLYEPGEFGERPEYSLLEGQSVNLSSDEFFMLSDFSSNAQDSRSHGPIQKADVVGVVTWIYWPPERFRIVR
jgi:signal peptidase I